MEYWLGHSQNGCLFVIFTPAAKARRVRSNAAKEAVQSAVFRAHAYGEQLRSPQELVGGT